MNEVKTIRTGGTWMAFFTNGPWAGYWEWGVTPEDAVARLQWGTGARVPVMLVGQAPSRRLPDAEPLSGPCGTRLARLMGMEKGLYLETFRRVNLLAKFPGKAGRGDRFPAHQAQEAAASFDPGGAGAVVLLGLGVRDAFGVDWPAFRWEARGGVMWAWTPHPSGVNRWWNDPANVKKARPFFENLARHALGGQGTDPPPGL